MKYLSDTPLSLKYGTDIQQQELKRVYSKPLSGKQLKILLTIFQKICRENYQYGRYKGIASMYLNIMQTKLQQVKIKEERQDKLEVKINKEIRDFTESIFFGLSLRQFIFSILACIVAVIVYFVLKPFFGIETLSWLCILCAVPFAVIGFLNITGMTAEKFISAWIKSVILTPNRLTFKPKNLYYEEMIIREKEKIKEEKKNKRRKTKTIENSKQNII